MHASNHAPSKERSLKKVGYFLYLSIFSFILLEVVIRVLSTPNKANVELFLNKKHHYLLPLPADSSSYYQESIAKEKKDSYRIYHDTLGWSHAKWGADTAKFDCYSNDKGYRISKAEYKSKQKAKTRYNIVAIGNSFTHGDAVKAEDTWVYKLQELYGEPIANLGVGGYGIHQALLRLITSNVNADTVLFGVIWGDLERALEPVYTFYQGGNKTRPILKFKKDGNYSLVNVPVMEPQEFYKSKLKHEEEIFEYINGFDKNVFSKSLWTYSYALRLLKSTQHQKRNSKEKPVYLTDDERMAYCMKIFELFQDYCQSKGIYGRIVLLDTGQNFWHKEKWDLDNPWDLLKDKLNKKNINFLEYHAELSQAFNEDRTKLIHPIENLHYSPEGNTLVANLIYQSLTQSN